jgi:hypothetical protein
VKLAPSASDDRISADAHGERNTHRSRTLGKVTDSPLAVLVQASKGQIAYLQFLEDTFCGGVELPGGRSMGGTRRPEGRRISDLTQTAS